jgi:large subunit ribosomal protein L24
MMRIKKGDTVEVIAGKHKSKRGKVLEVLSDKDRVRIEGVATLKRHMKPGRFRKTPQGGIVEMDGTVHISNVLPIDPKTDKPTRVGFEMRGDKKVRVARPSGTPID